MLEWDWMTGFNVSEPLKTQIMYFLCIWLGIVIRGIADKYYPFLTEWLNEDIDDYESDELIKLPKKCKKR